MDDTNREILTLTSKDILNQMMTNIRKGQHKYAHPMDLAKYKYISVEDKHSDESFEDILKLLAILLKELDNK